MRPPLQYVRSRYVQLKFDFNYVCETDSELSPFSALPFHRHRHRCPSPFVRLFSGQFARAQTISLQRAAIGPNDECWTQSPRTAARLEHHLQLNEIMSSLRLSLNIDQSTSRNCYCRNRAAPSIERIQWHKCTILTTVASSQSTQLARDECIILPFYIWAHVRVRECMGKGKIKTIRYKSYACTDPENFSYGTPLLSLFFSPRLLCRHAHLRTPETSDK